MSFINFIIGGFVLLGVMAIAMFTADALWNYFDNRKEKGKGGKSET